MQRVLKYPLLLNKLSSHTDRVSCELIAEKYVYILRFLFTDFGLFCQQNHEDYQGLCLAEEAIRDLAEYINEAKRDYEMRQIIQDVEVYGCQLSFTG